MTLSDTGLKSIAFSDGVVHEIHRTTEINALRKPFIIHSVCTLQGVQRRRPCGARPQGFQRITDTNMILMSKGVFKKPKINL